MRKIFLFPFFVFLCLIFSSANGNQPPLHVVTVATDTTLGFKRLVYSCHQNGIHLDVLGFGQPYSREDHAKKLRYMAEYLKTLPDEDLVLFVDGYDVIILDSGEEIVRRFFDMKTPALISAVGNLFPPILSKHKDLYPKAPTSFRFLNSGVYIGPVEEIKKMIHGSLEFSSVTSDDQGLMSLEFLKNLERRRLDYCSEIFLTLISLPKTTVDFENGRIRFVPTGSLPCIAHGNGGDRSYDLYISIYRHIFGDLSNGAIVDSEMIKEQCTFLPIVVK